MSRRTSAGIALQQMPERKYADRNREKAEHLAERNSLVELRHDGERRNCQSHNLQKPRERIHDSHSNIARARRQVHDRIVTSAIEI